MIENVFRLMSDKSSEGKPSVEIVREATTEVARPVAFAVGIIIIVFVPILTLTGVEGKMFKPMALTLMFALAGSLILALTLVPVLASLLIRKPPKNHETWLVRRFKAAYEPLLDRALGNRVRTVALAGGLFAIGVLAASTRGAEFIPRLDEGAIALQMWRLPSVSIDEAAQQAGLVEGLLLREFPAEVETVISKTGRPEIATDPMGVEMSDVFVMLRDPSEWTYPDKTELVEAMEVVLNRDVAGAAFGFSQPVELRVSELISGVRSDIAIQIYGDDLDELARVGSDIARAVSGVEGADDVKVEQVTGLPIMTARVDRAALARYGVNADDVLAAIEALGGRDVGVVLEGEQRFAIQVRFPPEVRDDPDAISRIPVAAASDRVLPLGELVSMDLESAAAQVSRESIQRRVSVELNVRGRDIASVVEDARQAIRDEVDIPPAYTLEWGGQFENLESASARLMVVVPVALLLIFVLLYSTFDAGRPALLIFLNVPFAAVGGVLALTLRGLPFSISAGIGFIALFGVAVLNGVVLVDYIRKLELNEGLPPAEAARKGALVRMRPVLMTALVAAFGFVPMALASGAGAEVQRPLATVVIGGLVTATLLTLFVLPSIYAWFTGGAIVPDVNASEVS